MDCRKYPNLRFENMKNAALPAMAGAALLMAPEPAMAGAATVSLGTGVSAGGAFWWLSNDTAATFQGASNFGLGITSASVSEVHAYSGAFVMNVNGAIYSVPNGIMDVSGKVYSSHTSATMGGLTVNAQFLFDNGSPTVRTIYTYTNHTGSPITVTIQWQNNLGGTSPESRRPRHARVAHTASSHAKVARPHLSSSTTSVITTSSGGAAETAGDRWVVTNSSGQAYIDSVRFGPGATTVPTIICQPGVACSALETSVSTLLIDQYSLTVPAGQTRALMFFGRISGTSTINTSTFDTTAALSSSGLLANLPPGLAESQIVNWFLNPQGPPVSVPAASPLSLLLTGAMIVALGMKFLKRPWAHR